MSEALEATVRRLADIHEIQNVMGRYAFLTTANMFTEVVDLFATTSPVKIEIATLGVWEGFDAAARCYDGFHNWTSKVGVPPEGQMMQHTLASPVIEVAGDGRTAKGVWMSPGHETRVVDGRLISIWCWGTYGDDFIREDDGWKIWHHHVYLQIFTPFDLPWTSGQEQRPDAVFPAGLPAEYKPDRPSTYAWAYSPAALMELVPAPPLPYETFDEATSYIE